MALSKMIRPIAIGLGISLASVGGYRFIAHGPEIVVAWGNARAEHERRLAAHEVRQAEEAKAEAARRAEEEKAKAVRRAEEQKAEAARRAEAEAYNESHCKVTVSEPDGFGSKHVTYSNVLRIEHVADQSYNLVFSGGAKRYIPFLVSTEGCR